MPMRATILATSYSSIPVLWGPYFFNDSLAGSNFVNRVDSGTHFFELLLDRVKIDAVSSDNDFRVFDLLVNLVYDDVDALYAFEVAEGERKVNHAWLVRLQDVEDESSNHLRATHYSFSVSVFNLSFTSWFHVQESVSG